MSCHTSPSPLHPNPKHHNSTTTPPISGAFLTPLLPGKLKLADFGISKVLSGEYAKTVMGGTPHYMAPELMSKNQCVWQKGFRF